MYLGLLSGFCSGLCFIWVSWCLISSLGLTEFCFFLANTVGGEKHSKHKCQSDRNCADICLKSHKKERTAESSSAEQSAHSSWHLTPSIVTSALTQVTSDSSAPRAQKPLNAHKGHSGSGLGIDTETRVLLSSQGSLEGFSQCKSLSCAFPVIHHMFRGQTNYPVIQWESIKADTFCLIAFASRSQGGYIYDKRAEQMTVYSFEAGIITAELS